jgi:thiamine biosynthesis lipoprotein
VKGGGDWRAGGLKRDRSWNIGIQDPRTPQKVMAKISTSVAAVATSGDYEKFFIYQGKRYHHIFSPKSGFPTEGFQSVTIVCKDLMTADALATAAFVLGPENGPGLLQKLEGVDWFIMDQDGRRALSPGLKKRISFTP